MHANSQGLLFIVMMAVLALFYAGRYVQGKPRERAEGLAFPLKPMVVWTRAVALPLYIGFFVYPSWKAQRGVPPWLLLMFFAVVMLALYQLPGTILLTPMAVEQRFWLRKAKSIAYGEVQAVQAMQFGRMTRVVGGDRVVITHTQNHAGAAEFRAEMERRTGSRVVI